MGGGGGRIIASKIRKVGWGEELLQVKLEKWGGGGEIKRRVQYFSYVPSDPRLPRLISDFCCIKQLGVLLLLQDGMLVHHK